MKDTLIVIVDPRGSELLNALMSLSSPEVAFVPFTFRLLTGGVHDAYPTGTEITIAFDATLADAVTGDPSSDPTDAFSGGDITNFATDIGVLNTGAWDFIRFKVGFDLDSTSSGIAIGAPRPGLDFLRMSYRF